jgi:hypothetical protein
VVFGFRDGAAASGVAEASLFEAVFLGFIQRVSELGDVWVNVGT